MNDLQFLHDSYQDKGSQNQLSTEADELESFGLNPKILIVEDDKVLGLSIKKFLMKTLKCEVELFVNSMDCLSHLLNMPNRSTPFCLITDISLEHGADGLHLIDNLKDKNFNFVSIVMTGFASIETAIAATKKGVYHYLTKPFELEVLQKLVMEAISNKLGIAVSLLKSKSTLAESKNQKQLGKIQIEEPTDEDFFCGMIGRSKVMKDVFERIEKVALTESTVLVTGASGTGKELVAGAIHKLSSRNHKNQVSVNCGAIPRDLLESELFGHTKGSFTGAISDRKGRFETAHEGTIFLDEIGDMPHLLQVKLLRVLQSKIIEPVGSTNPINVDTRVIAATHRDLEKMVEDNTFREDLFYRLNVIPIKVPALKERKEDIPLLISYFANRFVSADYSNAISFSQEALGMLLNYDWPGNVRELENIIERLVILRGGNEILPEDLPAKIFRHNPLSTDHYKHIFELPEDGVDLKKVLSDIEDSLILQALSYTEGNKNQASKLLSLNRTTLIEKMKKKSLHI
ncbi:MAG: sigma-54 dependent transcriptional regulator [Bacteriovoracaceae bacterium]|jgi:DNA-binding NtrC family response regulator|nr:sigma-54 dependent transcriptional regulator [Bacteriovoracaceae bacterium]